MSFVFTVPFHLYSWHPPQLYFKFCNTLACSLKFLRRVLVKHIFFFPLFQMVLVNCKNFGDLRHAGVILHTNKTCCPPRFMAIAQFGNSCMMSEK